MMVLTMPDGSIVLGTLELKGRNLEVQVNSEGLAKRAREVLDPILRGSSVRPYGAPDGGAGHGGA